jgi:hypothetical protein
MRGELMASAHVNESIAASMPASALRRPFTRDVDQRGICEAAVGAGRPRRALLRGRGGRSIPIPAKPALALAACEIPGSGSLRLPVKRRNAGRRVREGKRPGSLRGEPCESASQRFPLRDEWLNRHLSPTAQVW